MPNLYTYDYPRLTKAIRRLRADDVAEVLDKVRTALRAAFDDRGFWDRHEWAGHEAQIASQLNYWLGGADFTTREAEGPTGLFAYLDKARECCPVDLGARLVIDTAFPVVEDIDRERYPVPPHVSA